MRSLSSWYSGASLSRVGVVAESTFLECVRDRTLAVPLVLAGLLISAALFTRTLSLGQQSKLLQDFGLAGLCFFSNVLAILAVTTSVSRGVERGSLLPLLARPVRRGELLLGKFGGVMGVVLINVLVILAGLFLALFLVRSHGSSGMLWAAGLSVMEVMVVGALAVLFSVISSPVLAMMFSGLAMLIGHTTADIRELASRIGGDLAHTAGDVLYYVLPNLEIFDVRAAAVHGYPIEPGYVASAVIYGVLYAAVLLFVATWIFERRDLA
jgi:ABC-type transport system involved in multi-copper enzyme maturation permease subunit